MAYSDLFTLAELERAMGGSSALCQLAKAKNTSDPVYASFVAQVRVASQGDVYGRAKVAVDPLDPNVPASGLMRSHCLVVAVYWAWWYGTPDKQVPEEVSKAKAQALQALADLRSGDLTLDTEQAPTSNTGVKTVSLNSTTRSSRSNMGGFC